ncbi:MAG: ABC-2 family transporter protein [Lactobacillus sp.]|jgi:ABC-2 type transport system permease protein|nr:ABC-2 family transporter protein [Lactobacillus sp.]
MMKYLSIFLVSAKHSVANKVGLCGNFFLLAIILYAYNQLWNVISADSNQSGLNQIFIWYLLMGEIIILSSTKVERVIEDDIKSGTMAYYLNKPVSFYFMRYSESLGPLTITFLFLAFWGSLFVWLITSKIPFIWYHFPIILLNIYISCVIYTLLYTAVGFLALWLKEIRSLAMAVERFAFIFGGAIFPLTIYPEWFVNIAKFTPFYSLYYLSIKLIYDFSWYNLAVALGLNFMWTSIIAGFVYLAYRKLSKKVEVNGG